MTTLTSPKAATAVHHGALHQLGVYAVHHTTVVLVVVFIAYVLIRFNMRSKSKARGTTRRR